jgi:hypothetical protein
MLLCRIVAKGAMFICERLPMFALLPAPLPPLGSAGRGDSSSPPWATARPNPSVRPDTALALQPVEPADRGLDVRLEDSRGRPVGPPPAFQVSLLAAMHEAAMKPRGALPEAGVMPWSDPGQVDRKV